MILFRDLVKKFYSAVGLGGNTIRTRFFKAIIMALFLNIFFGTAFYFAEIGVQPNLQYWDSIWWAMVTMTTVGYGDFYAQTALGRYVISYPCMLVGIGIIGYLISALAESMVVRMARFRRGDMTIKSNKHIIICNCPSVKKVINLVEELRENVDFKDNDIVLVTDSFDEIPDPLMQLKIKFVKGSPADESILMKANFKDCVGLFVVSSDLDKQESDSYTLAIISLINMLKEELGCDPKVVVEVTSTKTIKMMKFSGIKSIVATEGISDRLMVQEFLYPGVHNIVRQIISNSVGSQFYIIDTKLHGRKLKEIQMAVLMHPEDLQVIGVIKGEKNLINPSKEYEISAGDRLIMLANSKADFEGIERDILNDTKA